jgi:hypothetical protein
MALNFDSPLPNLSYISEDLGTSYFFLVHSSNLSLWRAKKYRNGIQIMIIRKASIYTEKLKLGDT